VKIRSTLIITAIAVFVIAGPAGAQLARTAQHATPAARLDGCGGYGPPCATPTRHGGYPTPRTLRPDASRAGNTPYDGSFHPNGAKGL
jgi:hypothetical protein